MKPLNTALLKDTQRSYKWKALITEPGKPDESSGFFKDFLFDAVDDLAGSLSSDTREGRAKFNPILIANITTPSSDIEVEQIAIKGMFKKRPMASTLSTITIGFYETVDGEILQALEAWRNMVYNEATNTFGLPKDYQTDILVQLTTNYNVIHTTFKLLKCWPVTTEPLSLAYDSTGSIIINQSFAVEKMIIDQKGLFEVLTDLTEGDLSSIDIPGLSGGLRLGGIL